MVHSHPKPKSGLIRGRSCKSKIEIHLKKEDVCSSQQYWNSVSRRFQTNIVVVRVKRIATLWREQD